MQENNWHPSRINLDTEMAILEISDRNVITDTIQFYIDDIPKPVDWENIESLGSLLQGLSFHPKGKVTVNWDCIMGRVIRRNKTAFHVWRQSEQNIIETDKPTIALLLRGIAMNKLGDKLKRELFIIDLLSGNMYS